MELSDDELKKLLEPYIPAARKAVLPEEKPSKRGLSSRVMNDAMAALLADPKMAAQLAALREAREKK